MDDPVQGTFEDLRALLESRLRLGADPTGPLVIGAEANVRWRFVMSAMDAAVRAGFKNVQFAVTLGRSGGT